MKCYSCDNFQDNYPIKVIDFASTSAFSNDEIYHFEDGFKCNWNGSEELNVENLPKHGCRCTGGE